MKVFSIIIDENWPLAKSNNSKRIRKRKYDWESVRQMGTIVNSSPRESESYSQEHCNLTVKKNPSELNICMLQALCNSQSQ
jgi:hypothetical protein